MDPWRRDQMCQEREPSSTVLWVGLWSSIKLSLSKKKKVSLSHRGVFESCSWWEMNNTNERLISMKAPHSALHKQPSDIETSRRERVIKPSHLPLRRSSQGSWVLLKELRKVCGLNGCSSVNKPPFCLLMRTALTPLLAFPLGALP